MTQLYRNKRDEFILDGREVPPGKYLPFVNGNKISLYSIFKGDHMFESVLVTDIEKNESGDTYASIAEFFTSLKYFFTSLFSIANEFELDVARGFHPNKISEFKFGENPTLGTVEEVICYNGGNYDFIPFGTAEFLNVNSDDPDDTDQGLGAWDLFIIGLDITGALQTELVILNGLTSVRTTNKYSRLNRCVVLHSGTVTAVEDANQGDISVISEDSSFVQAKIGAHNGITTQVVYTVPLGFTAYVSGLSFNVGQGKEVLFAAKYRNCLEADCAFVIAYSLTVYQATFQGDLKYPFKLTELTDVVVTGKSSLDPSVRAHASFGMVLVDNNFNT